jgi:uncharacterized protein (TIGR02466 family)
MEVLNFFPVEFFVFKNKLIDNSKLIAELEALDNVEIKKTTTISLLVDLKKHEKFKELFSWFEECLEEIRQTMKYDCDKFEITNSWVNVALPKYYMHQNYHKHSMSFYSAVYYFTEGSSTEFEDVVIDRTRAQLEVLRHEYQPWETIVPEPGKLVIFPSYVYHRSHAHTDNTSRYILSFNTLPSGKINYQLATDSKAHIKVV